MADKTQINCNPVNRLRYDRITVFRRQLREYQQSLKKHQEDLKQLEESIGNKVPTNEQMTTWTAIRNQITYFDQQKNLTKHLIDRDERMINLYTC